MPNELCYHCGESVKPALSRSIAFSDGSLASAVPAKDVERFAPNARDKHGPVKPDSKCMHEACKRVYNAVVKAKGKAPSAPHLRGKDAEYQPPPERKVSMPSASEKAADLAAEGQRLMMRKRGSTTMLNMDVVELVAKANSMAAAASSHASSATPSGEASSSSSPSSAAAATATAANADAPAAPPKGTRKVVKGVSKFASIARVTAKEDLRKHAVWRGKALNEALAKLGRQTAQYQEQKAKVGELQADFDTLQRAEEEARSLVESMTEDLERLEVYDEAAATLAEAGLSDIPFRFALNVVNGSISTGAIFSRFMDDSMGCFEQSTPYTRRLSEPVKKWLTYALTKQSPGVSALGRLRLGRPLPRPPPRVRLTDRAAPSLHSLVLCAQRAFDVLRGDPWDRDLMGLPIPTDRTLRDFAKMHASGGEKAVIGKVNPRQVRAFMKFQEHFGQQRALLKALQSVEQQQQQQQPSQQQQEPSEQQQEPSEQQQEPSEQQVPMEMEEAADSLAASSAQPVATSPAPAPASAASAATTFATLAASAAATAATAAATAHTAAAAAAAASSVAISYGDDEPLLCGCNVQLQELIAHEHAVYNGARGIVEHIKGGTYAVRLPGLRRLRVGRANLKPLDLKPLDEDSLDNAAACLSAFDQAILLAETAEAGLAQLVAVLGWDEVQCLLPSCLPVLLPSCLPAHSSLSLFLLLTASLFPLLWYCNRRTLTAAWTSIHSRTRSVEWRTSPPSAVPTPRRSRSTCEGSVSRSTS